MTKDYFRQSTYRLLAFSLAVLTVGAGLVRGGLGGTRKPGARSLKAADKVLPEGPAEGRKTAKWPTRPYMF